MEPNLGPANPQIQPTINNQQQAIRIIIAVLLSFILGGAAVYLWQNPQFLNSLPFLPQPNAAPGSDSSGSSLVPADWKTYRLRKSYENSSVKFEIRYPKEWQISKEEGELMGGRVIWYIQDPDKYTFSVSWLNPDMIYSLAVGVCPSMCNKFSEVNTQEGVKIEILKPTPEGRKYFNLSDNYLIAFHPYNLIQNGVPTLEFSTTSLDSKTFSQILSTFKFTE